MLFKCEICFRVFFKKSNLRQHIKLSHLLKDKRFICHHCCSGFIIKNRLKRHVRSTHLNKGKSGKLCVLCHTYFDHASLLYHYNKEHNVAMVIEHMIFESRDSFTKWKNDYEKNTFTKYVKRRGDIKTKSATSRRVPELGAKSRNCATMAVRLTGVEGAPNCRNDLVYCPPLDGLADTSQTSTLVFFPGDVQSYPEVMEKDAENKDFLRWNIVDVALNLRTNFKKSHIVVIKCSRVESNVYSCYDNFVESDGKTGAPLHGSYCRSMPHLEALLDNIPSHLRQHTNTDIDWRMRDGSISLVGFSKGCVVLNQIIYELWKCTGGEGTFLKDRLRCMTWLDGGHAGTADAWITHRSILKNLSELGYELRVDVTPYQVCRRSWVGSEEKVFSDSLFRLGANITRRLHFEHSPPSLLNHFRLLDIFHNAT